MQPHDEDDVKDDKQWKDEEREQVVGHNWESIATGR